MDGIKLVKNKILQYRPEPSGSVKDGKYIIDKIMDYQLLIGQAAVLAYPVNV